MDKIRTRGRETMQMPEELEAVLMELLDASSRAGKSFPKMRAYADRIARGECTGTEAIRIVIRLLEPKQEEASGMSVEECRQHLEQEASELEAELAKIDGRAAELKERIAQSRKGITALDRVLEGKSSAAPSGYSHEKQPCEWPGCDRLLAPQGKRYHYAKHQRDEGRTLDEALEAAGVSRISA